MQNKNQLVVGAGLVVVIVVVGFGLLRSRGNPTPDTTGAPTSTVPAEVQQEFQRRGLGKPGMPTQPPAR